jgi:hypothetical protein
LLKHSLSFTFIFLLACSGDVNEGPASVSWNPCAGVGNFEVAVGTAQLVRGHYVTRWFGVPEEEITIRAPKVLGDTRDALRVSTPSHLSVPLPAGNSKLVFRSAIRRLRNPPNLPENLGNRSLHCEIFIREGEFLSSVATFDLAPPRAVMDQAWHPVEVDIPSTQGNSLEIVTRWKDSTLASQTGPLVEWANPRIFPAVLKAKPDVILVTIDTLRADAVQHMPSIQSSFSKGEWWTEAISPSSWTLPAYASLFTGLDVAEHTVGRGPFPEVPGKPSARKYFGLKQELPTLAETFRNAGYATCMVHQNPFLEPWTGLDRGFGRYARVQEAPEVAVQEAQKWWEQNQEQPRFLVLHLITPHLPYNKQGNGIDALEGLEWRDFFSVDHTPEERIRFFELSNSNKALLKKQYQEVVSQMDAQLGKFLEPLKSESDLILAFHADHGEEHWDNGSFEHGHSFDDSVVRVPLAIWETGMDEKLVHDGFVGAHWLGGTLLKRAGILSSWNCNLESTDVIRTQGSLYRTTYGGREFDPTSGEDRWLDLEEAASGAGRLADLPPELAAALAALGY